jgi:hypothetical protein
MSWSGLLSAFSNNRQAGVPWHRVAVVAGTFVACPHRFLFRTCVGFIDRSIQRGKVNSLGTAAAAAADAIAAHDDLKHVDKFTWNTDTVNVQLMVDCRRHLTGICLQSDLSIKSADTSPFANDDGTAKFRGLMYEKLSGKDVGAKSFATSKMGLKFSKGSASARDQSSGLESAIRAAFTDAKSP